MKWLKLDHKYTITGTGDEQEITHMNKTNEPQYCEDNCPIYEAIRQYNNANTHKICCTTDMCKHITDAYDECLF